MQANPSGVEFLRTIFKFRKRIKFRRGLFTSSRKSKIRQFYVVVVQKTAKKCTKKWDARAKLLFCLLNLLLFWTFSLPSRRRIVKSSLACKLCAKRNVPSTNWSKFLYIFKLRNKHEISVYKSNSLVSWRINSFASVRKCVVQLRCDGSEITTISNEFNQSLEGKKNLICRRLSRKKLPTRKFRGATAKKSDRKACVIMHMQSVQSNVWLVKTHCLNFFDFAKAP